MVCLRYTELLFWKQPSLDQMIRIQANGVYDFQQDLFTDCDDLLELVCGLRGVPQDRTQRLIILSLRERKALGMFRNLIWCDTKDMAANSLTKSVPFDEQLFQLQHTGVLRYQHPMVIERPGRKVKDFTEHDLEFDFTKKTGRPG